MSIEGLDRLFSARSVALVGASPRPDSLGYVVLRNLREAGFEGTIHPVNPRHQSIDGLDCAPRVSALPKAPDLVVIVAPAEAVPDIIEDTGQAGVSLAVILTAGLGQGPGSLAAQSLAIARKHGLRLIGPNCIGVISPFAKLNASFADRMPVKGDLALISQSGAVNSAMIEWASARNIGFSAVVSVGDMLDADIGDLLDVFAEDRHTRAILLYVEAVKDARKFLSAARAAARTKPVIVLKSGRHAQGARAAATHTGALAGSDAVYDAAFRRAGLLRVYDLDELFSAAEMVGRVRSFAGERLAILTNGGGVGVLAVDRLIDLRGTLADLTPETLAKLDEHLPNTWSRANPVDIIGDANPERYKLALEALIDDKHSDAVLVINCPTAIASSSDAAQVVIDIVKERRAKYYGAKPVFAVWLDGKEETRLAFEAAGVPVFSTEADAIQGYMHLVRYRRKQDQLTNTPPPLPLDAMRDVDVVRSIVAHALSEERVWLDPIEVEAVLNAYGIPATPVHLARTAEDAAEFARPYVEAGQSCAVKIFSRDIVHKSDVGGVRLNLTSVNAVRDASEKVLMAARRARPDARIEGVIVEPMILKPKARELIAGIVDDPTFGPVIAFGCGGIAVEVIEDEALALPPIDMLLAKDLINQTRIARLLAAYRNVPAADVDSVCAVLVKLSNLISDIPELSGVDLNPLLVDENGIVAVDARIAVTRRPGIQGRKSNPRFAIRPYPAEWERSYLLKDGRDLQIRAIRAEDEPLFYDLFNHVSAEDFRLRFFSAGRNISHAFIARLTQLDYSRAMAFGAFDKASGELMGVVRLHGDVNHSIGEYAVLIRSDLKGHGLGWALMNLIIEYARAEKYDMIEGQILPENTTMLRMCRHLGFEVMKPDPDSGLSVVHLKLHESA